jgi:hypothetical protein
MTGSPWPRLRWFALAWLLAYVPVYWQAYGPWHFLMLCNVGVLLSAGALISGNRLLLSSQAVASPGIALAWLADAGTRLATGHFWHGGTAYMWDASIPVAARALSLYHPLLPLLLGWCLRRVCYDRRALSLQAAIALVVLAVSLWLAPASEDLNYLYAGKLAPSLAAPATRALAEFFGLLFFAYIPADFFWLSLRRAGALPGHAATVAAATGGGEA